MSEGIAMSRLRAERGLIDFMSDHPGQSFNEAIAEKEARLAEQAAAIERDRAELVELKRLAALAAKHNLIVSAAPAAPKDGDQIVTVAELIDCYRTDPRSPIHRLRYRVRKNYEGGMRRIVDDGGLLRIADLDAPTIKRLYDQWTADGKKIAQGRAITAKLRLLASFGVTVLNNEACMRLSAIMRNMRFQVPQARSERLTADHAKAIRAMAHEMGRHSIALAQALQFDLPLKQTDVIGEWAPLSEPGVGMSDVISGKNKWIRGLRWEQIDSDFVLRHVTSMQQKEVVLDLKRAPMVMEELAKIGKLPTRGPMIICEQDRKPWGQAEYRRWWRKVANAAGLPKNVKNMDSSRAIGSNENRSREAPVAL
jgi:hypothetical protein